MYDNNNNLLILYCSPVQGSLVLLFVVYYNIVIARPPHLKDIKKCLGRKQNYLKFENENKRHPFVGGGISEGDCLIRIRAQLLCKSGKFWQTLYRWLSLKRTRNIIILSHKSQNV